MNTIYKILASVFCLMSIGIANAQTTKGDVLKAMDELYENIAQSDKDQTDYGTILQKVLEISGDLGQQSGFVCMKSGGDWYLYDSKSGSTVGSGANLNSCTASL